MNPSYLLAAAAALILTLTRKKDEAASDAVNASEDPRNQSGTIPEVPPTPSVASDAVGEFATALGLIAKADGSPAIARIVEKIFRLETGNFTSQLWERTNMCGQKAFAPAFPWGWPKRGTVASDFGPLVNMVDTGEGVASDWVNYKSVAVGAGYLAQFLRDHNGNGGRWNSTDAAKQRDYTAKLAQIPTPLTDTAWNAIKG